MANVFNLSFLDAEELTVDNINTLLKSNDIIKILHAQKTQYLVIGNDKGILYLARWLAEDFDCSVRSWDSFLSDINVLISLLSSPEGRLWAIDGAWDMHTIDDNASLKKILNDAYLNK